ncbi:hypothetical protein LPJ56_000955 [Coemansia sp. RSA 2599]|nr:hypothetical protein LPJ75_000269 [Coemansia sp. RSA 2598]KAJ1828692.1 hypothetical protein LPJ56_000955 [Coemansia sp. RSA 2599]
MNKQQMTSAPAPGNMQPCAFAHISGTQIQILPLSRTVLADDKSIIAHVTKRMNWSTPGIPVLLYPCDYPNNFLSQPPAKIHCFIQPHLIPSFFRLLEANKRLVFVNDQAIDAAAEDIMNYSSSSSSSSSSPSSAAHMSIGNLVH